MARVVAPLAFLAAVTIAVLLIRSGLRSSDGTTTRASTAPTTAAARTTKRHVPPPKQRARQFYTVQTGDTFGTIAAKYGISVTQLEQLNPGVSSNALTVGQKIRVK